MGEGDAGWSAPPRLVFVHGIGAPPDAEATRKQWCAALASGARRAGHSRFAATLEAGAAGTDTARTDIVFAYYGDLFAAPGAQGAADRLDDGQAALVRELLLAIIDTELALGGGPAWERESDRLEHARAQLLGAGEAQGTGNAVRRLINAATTLLAWGPLRSGGQWAAGKLLIRDLAQVARYLARAEPDAEGRTLDQRIRDRMRAALGDGPSIVVAHSLGTVVALETLHECAAPVPLLVTLGSPLAMRTVVWPRLHPSPPSTPERVDSWLNFWDRDDIIVPRPLLEEHIATNARGVRPVSDRVDSDGVWVHTATKYLDKAGVAGPIAEAAESPSPRRVAPA